MEFDRTIKKLLNEFLPNGRMRWLVEFVSSNEDLDFQVGSNKSSEWVSIYRGLSRLLKISPPKDGMMQLSADPKFVQMCPELYANKAMGDDFSGQIEEIRSKVEGDENFNRYYGNKKEGFYQNAFSRKFGILAGDQDDFVIIDKESVIAFDDNQEKSEVCASLEAPIRQLINELSNISGGQYGTKINEKSLGNELDFIGLNKQGEILLIEFKDGSNTSGIYLSPFQIAMYHSLFTTLDCDQFGKTILTMLEQRQSMGMISPLWEAPKAITGIRPVLVVSDYNPKSTAKTKFLDVLEFCNAENTKQGKGDFLPGLLSYHFTREFQLENWLPN